MRRYAVIIAVAGFFVLAAVGCLSGVPVPVCGVRALAGAAVLYVMVRIVTRVILGILVDAVLRYREAKESAGERGSE